MSGRTFGNRSAMYFVTSTVVGWVDVFTRQQLCQILFESIRYNQREKGLRVHGWCLMPSHLHAIVSSTGQPLSSIFRDFKKYTAKEIVSAINSPFESRRGWMLDLFSEVADGIKRCTYYKFWQDGNYPIELYDYDIIQQKLNYIHKNPVAAGIVSEPEHYVNSSAWDYSHRHNSESAICLQTLRARAKMLIDVDFLDAT